MFEKKDMFERKDMLERKDVFERKDMLGFMKAIKVNARKLFFHRKFAHFQES